MKSKMVVAAVHMPSEVKDVLQKKSKELRISVSEYIRLSVLKCLKEDSITVNRIVEPYKTCLICKEEKPNDKYHFHQLKRYSKVRGNYSESSPYCAPCHNKRNTEIKRKKRLKNK